MPEMYSRKKTRNIFIMRIYYFDDNFQRILFNKDAMVIVAALCLSNCEIKIEIFVLKFLILFV